MAAALGLIQCETQLAGSSVGTGNPTEIEVTFVDQLGPVAVSGRVEVFAATQIPVPGFSPEPLIRVDVAGEARARLDGEAFQALADSLWPLSSVLGDSAWLFNVVVTGENQGAVIRGLRFAKHTGRFHIRPEDAAIGKGGLAQVVAAVTPLVEIRGRVNAGELHPEMESFLFVYGTGFCAQGDSSRFVFPRMPSGEYETFLVSLWPNGSPIAGVDTLEVFRLDAKIQAGSEVNLSRNGVQETLPLPDPLKIK